VSTLSTLALTRLGPHGHPLAREALTLGALTLEPSTHHWDSSHGPVAAHPVTLRVDAGLLGTLHRAPGAHEALVASLSAAMSADIGTTLERLDLAWDGTVRTASMAAYRGSAGSVRGDTDTGRREALGAYLSTAHPEARQWVLGTEGVGLDARGRWCVIGGGAGADAATKRVLDGALRALTGDAAGVLQRA